MAESWWKPALRVPRGLPLLLGVYVVLGSDGRRRLARTTSRCIRRALRAGVHNLERWEGYTEAAVDVAAELGGDVCTMYLRWRYPSSAQLLVGDMRAVRSKDVRMVELTAAEEEVLERYLAYASERVTAHADTRAVHAYERLELLRGALFVYISRTDAASVAYAHEFVLNAVEASCSGDVTPVLASALQMCGLVTRPDSLLRTVQLLDGLVTSRNIAVRPWAMAALANVLQTATLVPETQVYTDVMQAIGASSIFLMWHLLATVIEDEQSRVRSAQCITVIQRVLPELVRDDACIVPLLSTSSHSLTLALLGLLESTFRANRLPLARQAAVREQLGMLQRELDAGEHDDATTMYARVLAPFLQLRVLSALCWLPPPEGADAWPVPRDRMLDRVDSLQGERVARLAGTAQGQLEAAIGIEYARVLLHYSRADPTVVPPVVAAIVGLIQRRPATISAIGMRLLGQVPLAVCAKPAVSNIVAELHPAYRLLLARARLSTAGDRSAVRLSVHALRALVHYHRLTAAAAASELRGEQERLGQPPPAFVHGVPSLQQLCEDALLDGILCAKETPPCEVDPEAALALLLDLLPTHVALKHALIDFVLANREAAASLDDYARLPELFRALLGNRETADEVSASAHGHAQLQAALA